MKRKAKGKSDQEARRGDKNTKSRHVKGVVWCFFAQRSFRKKKKEKKTKNRLTIKVWTFCIASGWLALMLDSNKYTQNL